VILRPRRNGRTARNGPRRERSGSATDWAGAHRSGQDARPSAASVITNVAGAGQVRRRRVPTARSTVAARLIWSGRKD
jgi:hypothetical protein